MLKKISLIASLAAFALSSASIALGEDAAPTMDHQAHSAAMSKMKEPTPEIRQKMADAHQKMADCLKSTKPISECKDEMMKNCPMMKNGHCMMMEGMSGHMDHMKDAPAKKGSESAPSE
jgi:hypothetical protein